MSSSLGFLAGRTLGTRNKSPELECLGNGCAARARPHSSRRGKEGKEGTFVSAELLQDIPAAAKPGSEPGGSSILARRHTQSLRFTATLAESLSEDSLTSSFSAKNVLGGVER